MGELGTATSEMLNEMRLLLSKTSYELGRWKGQAEVLAKVLESHVCDDEMCRCQSTLAAWYELHNDGGGADG